MGTLWFCSSKSCVRFFPPPLSLNGNHIHVSTVPLSLHAFCFNGGSCLRKVKNGVFLYGLFSAIVVFSASLVWLVERFVLCLFFYLDTYVRVILMSAIKCEDEISNSYFSFCIYLLYVCSMKLLKF